VPASEIPASTLSASESYRLMTDLVAPRPIAWVSTVDQDGRRNLAPFSYFQGVCSRPPTIVLGLGWHADGRMKDTLQNILETREFVVSHVCDGNVEAAVETSAPYTHEVSEWDAVGVEAEPSVAVRPPRVKGAKAALECVLRQAIPIGAGPTGMPSSTLVIAEVVHFTIAEGLMQRDARGRMRPIDPALLGAVGRMGGIAYTRTDSRLEIPRPTLATPPEEKP
jgi:flavin reductase (DIM6/NTAB) family NADH-FMN oxidoreductase RutF